MKLNGIHDFDKNNINIFLLFIWFLKIELIYLQRFFQKNYEEDIGAIGWRKQIDYRELRTPCYNDAGKTETN